MSWSFNPAAHEPNVGFVRQEEGDYTGVIKRTNAYNDQQGNAEGIKLTIELIESNTASGANTHVGKTYDWELAVLSTSQQRQEIANGDLSAICVVTNTGAFEGQMDAQGVPVKDMFAPALHDKPFKFSIVHTKKLKDDGKESIYANVRNVANMAGLDAHGNQAPRVMDRPAPTTAGQQAGQEAAASLQGQAPAQTQQQPTQGAWGGAEGASAPSNVQPPAEQQQPAQQQPQQPAQGGAPAWGGAGGGQPAQGGAPSWGGAN